jgi:glycine/D-amino acid oxidase-like deaminating enzyme
VSVEPVHVVNRLTSNREIEDAFPIIADYINLAYFRLWRDNDIHMHQPRKRAVRETARAFAESPLAVIGADFINDPTNQGLGYTQIKVYEEIARHRFNNIDQTVYGSGYRSYFDITPDLKFILGPDHRVPNLVHCLGAGQAFKYTPVFGEIIADFVVGGTEYAKLAADFSISRFDDEYMTNFWERVAGSDNTLEAETTSL